MPRSFGEKLRYLRQRSGVTQAKLARHLNVSRAYINNLEAGRKLPSPEFTVHIAEVFAISTDYLLRDSIPVESMLLLPELYGIVEGKPARLFGAKLRHLRATKHLTQTQLVEQLGLRSQAHVSLLESGVNEPSLSFILQIADLFGVTTNYLLLDTIAIEAVIFVGEDETPSS